MANQPVQKQDWDKRLLDLARDPRVMVGGAVMTGLLVLALWLSFPLLKPLLADQFSFSIIMIVVGLGLVFNVPPICIWLERKLASYIQDRFGPNRVGPWGLLQPLADGLKFLVKEDMIPANVDKPLYVLAPAISFVIAMLGFAVIPWAGNIHWPWMPEGQTVTTQVADIDVGFLYVLAVASLGVYGVVLGGWASNNKYSFYGGMRATAQMLSYEVPLGLGLLCVLLVAGNLRLDNIINQQAQSGMWNIFLHPIAFFLVLISAFAETNRTPFDLAEAEQELIGGYHTEYSAMKFGLFFLAEYAHMFTNSALMVAMFCGGWAPLPFIPWLADNHTWWAALIKFGVFLGKVSVFIFFYMLVRWTIPRFRYDQLMRLAWKTLVPVGMALVLATGVLVVFNLQRSLWASLLVNLALIGVAVVAAARARKPVTGRQENLPPVEVRPG